MLCAWGASDGARQDEAADAAHPRRALVDAGAGKWAVREQVCQGQDARCPWAIRILEPLDAAAEPYTPDAVPSAERSCVVQAAEARPELEALRDAAEPQEPLAERMPRSAASQAQQVLRVLRPPESVEQ